MKYTTLSGKEGEISQDFIAHGLSMLWELYSTAKNPLQKKLLNEAQLIISAVLYGSIEK